MKHIFVLLLVVCSLLPCMLYAEDDPAEHLVATWLVSMKGDSRRPAFRISGVKPAGPGSYRLDAEFVMEWQGSVQAEMSDNDGKRTLAITTPRGAKILAAQSQSGTFVGSLTMLDGGTREIEIRKVSEAELRTLRGGTADEATVTTKVALGRSSFALPPGDWKVIPAGSGTSRQYGEATRHEVGRFLAVQANTQTRKLKAAVYYVTLLATMPGVPSWSTTVCDPTSVLHRDTLKGNFNYPECLLVDYWTTPRTAPPGMAENKIWDWSRQNGITLPVAMLTVTYAKYRGGEYVLAYYWLNPEEYGVEAASERSRPNSEWSASLLKSDAKRSAYVEAFKKWSYIMAENASGTLVDRVPKQAPLPDFPIIK